MNILVTGGAGFIGSHTVVALLEAGFNPIIIDNFSNSEPTVLDGLKKITGRDIKCDPRDCNNPQTLREIFAAEQIGGVIHFAACKAVGESMHEPLKYYRNNLGSLIVLLEAMVDMKVPNLIFSSSCTIYGQPDDLPVTETAPFKPAESVYGNTKQVGEEILRDVHAANVPIRMISLRYFNPIGAHPSSEIGELPRGVPSNLVPFVTQTAAGIRPSITVFGDDYPTTDGTCVRDYIHVMDLAEAHVAAMQRLVLSSQSSYLDVFNLGTGTGNTVLEILKTFEKTNNLKLNYQIGGRRSGDVVAVYADVDKAARELGWRTRRTLEDALRDAWNCQVKLGR
jgi:UDP-glucose 4-epimerase